MPSDSPRVSDINAGDLRCSFCNKSQAEVAKLITNPIRTACICNECVEVCGAILKNVLKDAESPQEEPEKSKQHTTDGPVV
jgi:ATP-dependent Clp protease ATP-binding subunit ClpX